MSECHTDTMNPVINAVLFGGFYGVPRHRQRIRCNFERLEKLMLAATVSGSFHRHMGAITAVVHQLAALSVRVLSPADPRIVAQQGEFLFVASDPVRSV